MPMAVSFVVSTAMPIWLTGSGGSCVLRVRIVGIAALESTIWVIIFVVPHVYACN